MKVRIASGFKGKISTGSYENVEHSYYADVEFEVPPEIEKAYGGVNELVSKIQTELQALCYQQFKATEQRQIVERISKERIDLRWYDGKPSVTSIIGWDADFHISPEELR